MPQHRATARLDSTDQAILIAERRTCMAVTLGRSRLLRWRIRRGQVIDVEECIAALTRITGSVHAMETRIAEMERNL